MKNEARAGRCVNRLVKKAGNPSVSGNIRDGVIFLSGDVPSLTERLSLGFGAARIKKRFSLRGVVNDITVAGLSDHGLMVPEKQDNLLEGRHYDAVIIGGGIIGTATARELSRYHLSVALLEKEEDLGLHASSRNDGMIHPGLAAKPGTLKAFYNIRGNRLYSQKARELGFTLKRPGSLLLFDSWFGRLLLPILKRRARQNGVPRTRWVSRNTLEQWEPSLTPKQRGGFFMPSAGIVSPQEVVLAYGENAAANGVEFFFETTVSGLERRGNRITSIQTNRGDLCADVVINAAGIWADRIAALCGDRFFSLHPRKGVDAILDKKLGRTFRFIAGMPSLLSNKKKHSKGGGLVPCVEGNLLLGPTAREVLEREDYSTRETDLEGLKTHLDLNRDIRESDIITYYAGIRAATWEEDFIVQPSDRIANLIHAAGIQSPGFASAPAIAEDLAEMTVAVLEKNSPERTVMYNPDFIPERPRPPVPSEMDRATREKLIAADPAYGRIICRCEEISEGEIRDALHSPLPAVSVDGIKRRTRAGAGRCHGGFCLPRVMEIIARETGRPLDGVNKGGAGSWILSEKGGAHE